MELIYKEDWQQAEQRMEAWWNRAIVDRAVVQVTAPRAGVDRDELARLLSPGDNTPEAVNRWFTDPDLVVPRLEKIVAATYWGGEAFPLVFPVSISLVAITSAYLGCPYRIHPTSHTAWADPIIEDWEQRPTFAFDPENEWWRTSRALLETASQRAPGRFYVGVPDLNGPGEIVARLRDSQRLAVDLLENPVAVKSTLAEVNVAWLRYWEAAIGIIHQWIGGYYYWIGAWSDRPSIDLQCDFSCLISTRMFEEFFLPALEQQTRWVERTIYHLDGPGAIRHLDSLLALPRLTGIQWVPGAGAAPMSQWIRLLRRIQSRGKLLTLSCEPWEVEILLAELEPEGLLLSTHCDTEEEARELLRKVERWSARGQWLKVR